MQQIIQIIIGTALSIIGAYMAVYFSRRDMATTGKVSIPTVIASIIGVIIAIFGVWMLYNAAIGASFPYMIADQLGIQESIKVTITRGLSVVWI